MTHSETMSGLYVLEDWTLYDCSDDRGDYRFLRGRPVGHPNKPSDRTIMTTHVERIGGGVATTQGGTCWILGEAA